ncbi:response regulator transcription factor [Cupriavidus basilensis]|uniref:response regulator transcription factor n=1 Tax=Cupriavidus basilensis TaxID=68895 RepID=UPI0020A6A063|nr:DNA-binding response regulator [Cupriavidus basilensis]MCP3023631.1 DNA-binding response regulator [Cupriavidus basilensis]MDR3379116.1 DNA-binding response regulator [Cupriavidus basilensis]
MTAYTSRGSVSHSENGTEGKAAGAGVARAHLLIVNSRPDELRPLIELLCSEQYRVSVAFDGAQGYHRAQALSPSLILLDVRLPGLDGFSACRLLKANPRTRDIPVIFLTDANSIEERLYGLQNGGVDYILRSSEPVEVSARIRIHLALAARRPADEAVLSPSTLSGDQVLVQAVAQYLTDSLAATPNLAELARRFGTHEKRLSRAFREQLGKTVFEYLRESRLLLSKRLLAETSLKIVDIAAQVGFSSAANFATAFREQFNLTPRAFRHSVQGYVQTLGA